MRTVWNKDKCTHERNLNFKETLGLVLGCLAAMSLVYLLDCSGVAMWYRLVGLLFCKVEFLNLV